MERLVDPRSVARPDGLDLEATDVRVHVEPDAFAVVSRLEERTKGLSDS